MNYKLNFNDKRIMSLFFYNVLLYSLGSFIKFKRVQRFIRKENIKFYNNRKNLKWTDSQRKNVLITTSLKSQTCKLIVTSLENFYTYF